MTVTNSPELGVTHLPDHTELPESDGTFVKNFQEHPQSILLTDSIEPVLQQLHPDGQYCIGQDCGIYWRLTNPPERGAEAPDWFYVPNVPPMLKGQFRRSYVLWQEYVAPLIVLEFASGDGLEERDRTPPPLPEQEGTRKAGKFWVYEQAIRVPFYGIYEMRKAALEVYHLVEGRYELLPANERGHYAIPQWILNWAFGEDDMAIKKRLGCAGGIERGNLLLTGDERSELLESRLEQERQRAERLAERLRQMGVNPDEV